MIKLFKLLYYGNKQQERVYKWKICLATFIIIIMVSFISKTINGIWIYYVQFKFGIATINCWLMIKSSIFLWVRLRPDSSLYLLCGWPYIVVYTVAVK